MTASDTSPLIRSDETPGKRSYFSDTPNFFWIELSLMINVFLSGFDGTITASTYSTIGSEFKAINLAPWITTSYLVSSTAFQPLYGSISDIVGRRPCIVFSLVFFSIGCYGCYLADSMWFLITMRALTGVGGGGLMTLSTITNSDIIYPAKRGVFQAVQNLLLGTGAIVGASVGGFLTNHLGWRWCFALQVFPAIFSLIVAICFISGHTELSLAQETSRISHKIDFKGSATLVLSLTGQLLILSFGGNDIPWLDWRIGLLAIFTIFFTVLFYHIESTTTSIPIIPVNDYKLRFVAYSIVTHFCIGFSAYSYLFTLPLLFQINLGDNISQAGFRLAIPALGTPVGGIFAGLYMIRHKYFSNISLIGASLMGLGNFAAMFIYKGVPNWIINTLLVPTTLGQGMVYPTTLFIFIYFFPPTKQASSTSTVYLVRNIGGVWGVTYISSVIQVVLRTKLKSHLEQLVSKKEAADIVLRVTKSIDILDTFEENVRQAIVKDYTLALRIAQFISGACGFIGFVMILFSRREKRI